MNRFPRFRCRLDAKKRRPPCVRLQLELLEGRNLLSAPAVIDVVGHLPIAEYNQFIANAVNYQGDPYKDWGNEPSIAVNPANPSQIVVSSFAYGPGSFVESGPGATQASLWYSTDGGSNWVIRFPISGFPAQGQSVPDDQTFAYDANGVLHGAFLTFPSHNIFQGTTADPNLDGVNGRPASVWQWNPNRVNLPNASLNSADMPWIALQGNHVYVGYNFQAGNSHGTAGTAVEGHVSASSDNGATFTSDNAISNGSRAAFVNPGVRLATDAVGNTYAMFETADPSLPELLAGQPQMVHYRLNESTDGGASWKYTRNDPIGGLVIDDGMSLQLGSSFGGVNNTNAIDALAADPTGAHVYAVYGKQDASGTDRLYLAEFHPDGQGGLIERANPVALSVPGQRSSLPSIAVAANGTLAVQYDTFTPDDGQFHVHLATSADHGLTFADQTLDDFTATGIPFPETGGNRLLGDYQYLIALGNTFYGTFAARGNVNNPSMGINTTDKIDPFFYSAAAPPLSGGAEPLAAVAPTASVGSSAAGQSVARSPMDSGSLPASMLDGQPATEPASLGLPLFATQVNAGNPAPLLTPAPGPIAGGAGAIPGASAVPAAPAATMRALDLVFAQEGDGGFSEEQEFKAFSYSGNGNKDITLPYAGKLTALRRSVLPGTHR
jgi:hypothetical protein